MTYEEQMAIVRGHAAQLMEHFDCVQIFACKANDDETSCCNVGNGNYYARYGMAKDWILQEEALSRLDAREGRT